MTFSPRNLHLRPLLVGTAFASVFVIAALVPQAAAEHGPVMCPLKFATGLDCPFCGLTRSFVCAAHGSFAAATTYNPAWPAVALVILMVALLCWRDAFCGSHSASRLRQALVAKAWLILGGLMLLTGLRWWW